jgi:hypothetical protein
MWVSSHRVMGGGGGIRDDSGGLHMHHHASLSITSIYMNTIMSSINPATSLYPSMVYLVPIPVAAGVLNNYDPHPCSCIYLN